MEDIRLFYLINGETIIGNLIISDAENNILENPRKVVFTQNMEGMNVLFPPVIIGMKKSKVTIKNIHIICDNEPDSEIEEFYRNSISKIKIPDRKIII